LSKPNEEGMSEVFERVRRLLLKMNVIAMNLVVMGVVVRNVGDTFKNPY